MPNELFYTFAYEFGMITFTFVILIMLLRIVWRVEKKLDVFFKFLTAAFAIFFIRHVFVVLERLNVVSIPWLKVADVAALLLIIIGLGVMTSIISHLDNER